MPRGFLEALGIEPAPQARRSGLSHGGHGRAHRFPACSRRTNRSLCQTPNRQPSVSSVLSAMYQLRFTPRIDPDCQRCRLRLLSLLRKTRTSGTLVAWLTRYRVLACNLAACSARVLLTPFHCCYGVAHKPRSALAVGVSEPAQMPTRLAPGHLLEPLTWRAESGAGLRPFF